MFTSRVVRRSSGKLDKIAASLRGPKKVKVGFPAGETGGDIISRAVWNEFGTRGGASGGGWGGPIPPRPFMANAMRDNRSKYRGNMAKGAKSILNGTTSLRTTLSKLGIQAQGDIQHEITALATPPNSPVTIRMKGSSNPLIDTAQMRQSVTYKVDD